ncbi:MAG: triphosphoribosyl-dephospho-CoA synthase [Candidatus Bathyarchaeota archaeon]|nr:MAG: triphosphoribosyl-dephospho-CoA synthase [Candidatus Bathyarchaeota archaeon]
MHQPFLRKAKYVSSCLQLAILLEASANKPGNVNRTEGFQNTRFEHFLASAVAVEPYFATAAQRGIQISEGKIEHDETGLGEIIRDEVMSVNAWQRGGNTILGTILLLSPIAVASGITLANNDQFSISELRRNIKPVVEFTTPSDAVAVYEAIKLASPGGLSNKTPALDVNDPKSKETILAKKVTLYDIFRMSTPYDSVSKEWTENYPLTFEIGFPFLTQQLEQTGNLNTAIVHTFLKLLSVAPDSLIARKAGLKKAQKISEKASQVLKAGGSTTNYGRDMLFSFDKELRRSANQYNPGTTADIVASVLAVSVLNGYRP